MLFITLLIIANLIWIVERKNNQGIPENYLKGIWESLWWAAVTVTTVGYGDKIPISKTSDTTPMGVTGMEFSATITV